MPTGDICCVSCRVYFSRLYGEDITFSKADVIFLTNAVMSKKKKKGKKNTPFVLIILKEIVTCADISSCFDTI